MSSHPDSLILDFFSGSATTAHAVMQLNAEDGGNRRFIMVQLPESCPADSEAAKAGYATICDIGKERIRRAGAKIRAEHPDWQGDTGFRVYKLDSSNLKVWNPQVRDAEAAFIEYADHVLPGRSHEDLLAELMLKQGIDLCFPVAKRVVAGHEVLCLGQADAFVCLSGHLSREDAQAVALAMVQWKHELDADALVPNQRSCAYLLDKAFSERAASRSLTSREGSRRIEPGDDAAKLNFVITLKEQGQFKKVRFI